MIQLQNLTLRRGSRALFENATLQIHPNWKVGLTGVNGAGKSSLFSALLGQLGADVGELSRPQTWTIAHMAQEIEALDMTALDFVLSGDEEYWQIQQQLQHSEQLSHDELARLHGRFDEIQGYSATAKASQLLAGLGFLNHQITQTVQSFSGGWRMRLNLARTLMSRSDLLLLDEPTNHLDLDAILWLEDWLNHYQGTLILISHDRDFLDAVTDHILHIENAELTLYTGNYSSFEVIRSERLAQQQHIRVIPIAGACAAIAGLSAVGLPSDKFSFQGFLPAKATQRIKQLEQLKDETQTLIFYEAPHRIVDCLQDMVNVFGAERLAGFAREISKTFETIKQMPLGELLTFVQHDPNQQKGEIVVMIDGAEPRPDVANDELDKLLQRLLQDVSVKVASQLASDILGVKKKIAYQRALELSQEHE